MFLFSKKTIAVLIVLTCWSTFLSADLLDEVEHGYADNDGVKIHYATVGEGPLVVMIHGFPDFLVQLETPDGRSAGQLQSRGY